MARPFSLRGAAATLAALIPLLTAAAAARDLDPSAFGPVLDGVQTELRQDGGLTPYVFQGGRDWPAIRLQAEAPLDWSAAAALGVEVDNPAATPFELLIRLDDRAGADGDDRSLTGIAMVAAQQHVTVLLPLGTASPGMRGQPPSGIVPGPGEIVMGDVRGTVDPRHIVALHLSGVRGAADRTLRIGRLTLREGGGARSTAGPIADAFGQAIAGRWPEKVASEADLRDRLTVAVAQTRRLAASLPPPADRWGGVDGTAFAATGAFRVATHNGRWMLVTPAGRAFFSLGVDAVQATNPTVVAGREALFAGLPSPGSALARHLDASRRTFDVGTANLERGLGRNWAALWPATTLARLRAWGFNTLGNWSDAALAPAMPHVVFYDVEGASATVPMGGRALPDPFDPRFAAVADAVASQMTAAHRDDAGLIGYFSGNELPWGETDRPAQGIAAHVLGLGPDSPARQALVAALRARHGTPAALARAWDIPAPADWDGPISLPDSLTAAARQDVETFEARFADLYFSTAAAAIHRHDPAHLYLGTRFAAFTPAVVRACARWCDVLSFNVYGATPEAAAAAWRGLGRPVLLGEFHFGSLDRGAFWPGMVAVPTEAERGPAYATYLAAAVADPQVVGCHWYQYADEPLTGRPYDGENGHIGLVAVTDVPYAGFVENVAAANRRAVATFAQQVGAAPR